MHVKFVISQGLQFVTRVAVAPMLYKNDRLDGWASSQEGKTYWQITKLSSTEHHNWLPVFMLPTGDVTGCMSLQSQLHRMRMKDVCVEWPLLCSWPCQCQLLYCANELGYAYTFTVCLFACLGFNGTFSTNRLYRAI